MGMGQTVQMGHLGLKIAAYETKTKVSEQLAETNKMMRFFLPSHPAGRLEYLLVMVFTWAVSSFAIAVVLGLSVNRTAGEIAYESGAVNTVLSIQLVVLIFQLINQMRRLTDMNMGSGWLVCNFAPLFALPAVIVGGFEAGSITFIVGLLISVLFQLYLLIGSGVKRDTYAPYGDNPYDPASWVPPAPTDGSSGPAVTFQGQALRLPGETDEDVENAA